MIVIVLIVKMYDNVYEYLHIYKLYIYIYKYLFLSCRTPMMLFLFTQVLLLMSPATYLSTVLGPSQKQQW